MKSPALHPEFGTETPLSVWVVPCRAMSAGQALFHLEEAMGAPSVLWVPREGDEDGFSSVGFGAAAEVTGRGASRFEDVREAADRIFARLGGTGKLPFAPRMFGGFSFSAEVSEPATSALYRTWAAFGDAHFVLPYMLYSSRGEQGFLVGFAPPSEEVKMVRRLEGLRLRLEGARGPVGNGLRSSPSLAPRLSEALAAGRTVWDDLVRSALREIDRGAFGKVVLSRAASVRFETAPDIGSVFRFLEDNHPNCVRFLFQAGQVGRSSPSAEAQSENSVDQSQPYRATFLGATPERLVSVQGRQVTTEALAGSMGRRGPGDDSTAREALLASKKDRAEHAFVSSAIRSFLTPFCEALQSEPEPQVRSLPHLHHLVTPIRGTLRDRVHIVDLVRTLHPTPALCGTPTDSARAFILAEEAAPRGWYGGAVGFFDSKGEGSFAVAIRSALVTAQEGWIYAGAGIVEGSDPAKEYIETTIKERTMRDALGVSP